MNLNEYHDLVTTSRKVYASSILREQVSRYLTETILIVEENIDRELTNDELENILILLTNENT